MRSKSTRRQPAPRDSRRSVSRYLDELIDYGGLPATRAEAIIDMQRMGIDQACIDRWLQGQELAQRQRERRNRLNLRIFVEDPQLR